MDAARLEDVVVGYGSSTHTARVRALDGLTLGLASGRVTALLGPNGAGKSTAVGVLAGLIRATTGRVTVLDGAPGRREARQRVNVMVQDDGLPTGAYAAETVRHVARLRGAEASADPWISSLGLSELKKTAIRRLSGGERRRVSLACALVGSPDMVILDEPTTGLDPQARALVWRAISELRDRGASVLLCTHLLDEAEALADDVAIIMHGRCLLQGDLATIGSETEESVIFDAPLHLDMTALQQALPESCRASELSPGRYRVAGDVDPQVLATVTAWCAQHSVMPRNLHTGGQSLSDVYWRLTSGTDGSTSAAGTSSSDPDDTSASHE